MRRVLRVDVCGDLRCESLFVKIIAAVVPTAVVCCGGEGCLIPYVQLLELFLPTL